MALKIFCGPFQPSLEQAFLARIQDLKPGLTRAVAVITPSRGLADRLQRLLTLEAELSVVNVHFHSFRSLACEVAGESLDRNVISDGLFHDKLVDRILRERKGGRSVPRGLAGAYRTSMRDLVDAGLDPAEIDKELLDAFSDEAARERMRDLLDLLKRYYAELKNAGILPPSGQTRAAEAAVRAGRAKTLERFEELVYYGFYDLTGVQGDFFHEVTSNFPSSVFFPYRKNHPAFKFAERTLSSPMLRHGSDDLVHLDPGVETRALGKALDAIWDPQRPEPEEKSKGLEVLSVSGTRDEVWRTAKEILSLTERKINPVPFERIGVVARALESYRPAVCEIFNEHRIPFTIGEGEPLLQHPIAKLGLSLLTWSKRQYPAETIRDILSSPYFRRDEKNRQTEYLSSWRRLIERQGVHSGWLQWEGKIGSFKDKDYPLFERSAESDRLSEKPVVIPAQVNGALWSTLHTLKEGLAPEKVPSGWRAMTRHARTVLEENFKVSGGGLEAWETLLEAVSSLEYFDKALPGAGWDDFLEVLEERLGGAVLDAPSESRGVRVLSAMDARGEGFQILFMLGLKQGMFPRQIREDPFLKDIVARRVLRSTWGYWITEMIADGYEEERLLFYLTASSASEKVYCLLPRSSDEGRAQTPSTYLRELCRVASRAEEGGDAEYVPRLPAAKIESLTAKSPELLGPKEILVSLARAGRPCRPFLEKLSGWPESWDGRLLDACKDPVRSLKTGAKAGEWDGMMNPAQKGVKRILTDCADARFSPSSLKLYLGCPFHFYARKVLRLREDDEPSESGELQAWKQGELYHSVLEEFHTRLIAAKFWDKPEPKAWQKTLETCIQEILDADSWRSIGVYPVLWESLRESMTYYLRETAAVDMQWLIDNKMRPIATERMLEGDTGSLKLRGKIDRIDMGEDGKTLRVVDYKSRRRTERTVREYVRKMWDIQPAVYPELLCLSKEFKSDPENVSEAVLLPLENIHGVIDGDTWGFPGEDWRLARGRILENLHSVQDLVRKGFFAITPAAACDYCHFSRACRKAHPATVRRSENGWGMDALAEARDVPELGGTRKKKND